jgi:hypothetical protein
MPCKSFKVECWIPINTSFSLHACVWRKRVQLQGPNFSKKGAGMYRLLTTSDRRTNYALIEVKNNTILIHWCVCLVSSFTTGNRVNRLLGKGIFWLWVLYGFIL